MDETMPNQDNDLEQRLLKELQKHKLTDSEMNLVLKNLSKVDLEDRIPKIIDHSGNSRHIKVGYFTDTHMGNINFDEDLFLKCVSDFNKAKVDIIYTSGDIIDGCSGRDGAILEQNKLGLSAQVKYASDLLNLFDTKVYGITGNHELWSKNKLNQGLDAGDYLESKCRNYVNLGQMEADIDIGKKNVLKLYHGQDGSAYSPGYRGMKLIESLGGGKKPKILLSGHTHKFLYMFQRNIHYLEGGTLEGQTEFMRGKKLMAHKGYSILDIYFNKDGIQKFIIDFKPKYD